MDYSIIKDLGVFHGDRNAFIIGGEPMIFHCHHYNTFLQQSIEDTRRYVDTSSILTYSAEEVAHAQFQNIFATGSYSEEERKAIVENLYSFCGFGEIDLSEFNASGGMMDTVSEHYAIGWKIKFGQRKENEKGVCYFTLGFLIGSLEAVYDKPLGSLDGEQMACLTKGDPYCSFVIYDSLEARKNIESPGEGKYQTFNTYPNPADTNVDYAGIREALGAMPIEGDDKGIINAFGVYLTRHYANYYCLVSYKLIEALKAKLGNAGITIAEELLVESGHVCAFNTFGGIMLSDEWNALIKPMLETRNDWAHGILACINALGWGLWQAEALNTNGKFNYSIQSSYESNAFITLSPDSEKQSNFLAQGGTAGICNLIFHGDIQKRPQLDDKYYAKIFKSRGRFASKPEEARMGGSATDTFEVGRSL